MARSAWLAVLFGLLVVAAAPLAFAGGLEPAAVTQEVDHLLATELFGGTAAGAATPTARSDDATFLRRASLDLIGHPSSPEQVTAFSLDPAADKRAVAIDRLLADPRFGDNWARYWRDVIMFRRSEDRALLVVPAMVKLLAEAFNNDPHWDKIARAFMTATGDVRDSGATAIFMAQMGVPEDSTAEISRIFLGIQIQCAQCHNHPTDRWKREQFHELAAFFPRIGMRPVRDGEKRSFEIVSVDRGPKNKKDKPGRGSLEHYMPDLKHPEDEGKLMKPVFFVTGQKLEIGTKDHERREKVAEWITGRTNRWFAKAFVNRMWSELVGRGFYEPVDDIGPDRKCSAPRTLDYLSDRFAASHYDVKWLMRVITATEAYQRQSRSRYEEAEAPFAASCPQRLRGDQLFNSLAEVLNINEAEITRKGGNENNYRAVLAGPRGQLNATFGYDPSERRDEIAGSIPQALLLMNGPMLGLAMSARAPNGALAQVLASTKDDQAVVQELYLRAFGREATADETKTCIEYVKKVGNRTEAFEDVLWALVNSTEFLNRK